MNSLIPLARCDICNNTYEEILGYCPYCCVSPPRNIKDVITPDEVENKGASLTERVVDSLLSLPEFNGLLLEQQMIVAWYAAHNIINPPI